MFAVTCMRFFELFVWIATSRLRWVALRPNPLRFALEQKFWQSHLRNFNPPGVWLTLVRKSVAEHMMASRSVLTAVDVRGRDERPDRSDS